MPIGARVRRILVAAVAVGLGACGAFLFLRPRVEERLRARLEREARGVGLSATAGAIRLRPWLALELRDLVIQDANHVRIAVGQIVLRPRLSPAGLVGRAANVAVSPAAVELWAGLRLELQPSAWAVESGRHELRLHRVQRGEEMELSSTRDSGGLRVRARASGTRLSKLLQVLFRGCVVADLGTVDGEGQLEADAGAVRVELHARTRGFALASLAATAGPPCNGDVLGAPTDGEVEIEGVVRPQVGSLRFDRLRLVAGPAEATGTLAVEGGFSDPRITLDFEVGRLDLARLLATAGLDLPADDLGSAAFGARVNGRVLEPAGLAVTQRLDFDPPARPLPAIERLKDPFVHRVETSDGRTIDIVVSPDSPDFVPLAEVPPLLVKTLLLGEDSNFFGHRGIDLSELPSAVATNLARGGFVRGASTIPQQLAKNMFLSSRRTLSRKLEELSLALLLDSTLGKERELEIYLNVIEWGPGLYGLRPAARHYFGREPQALAPKQMAFLVALIPGPTKYQRSFAAGVPTPFFEGLMTTLLDKLRSVGALSQAEYEAALAEPLGLQVPPVPSGG